MGCDDDLDVFSLSYSIKILIKLGCAEISKSSHSTIFGLMDSIVSRMGIDLTRP